MIEPDLARAIDHVIMAGHGQRHWLRPDHPPLDAPLADAVKHYGGPSAGLDLWAMCAATKTLETVWNAIQTAAAMEAKAIADAAAKAEQEVMSDMEEAINRGKS